MKKLFAAFCAGISIAVAFSAGAIISGQSGIPAGTVVDYAGTGVPSGWLACDGVSPQTASRTGATAGLFAAIGTTWGVGDGSTTMGIPALARRVTVGSTGSASGVLSNTVSSIGGSETLSVAQMPAHSHSATPAVSSSTAGAQTNFAGNDGTGTVGSASVSTNSQGSGSAFYVPAAVVRKLCKL